MSHLRAPFTGPALFSYGFRPFFLAATLFGVLVVPVWLLAWRGDVALSGPFSPVDWHVHEMLFGYAAAVIAGFLFTAVPNWTGRMPARGWPLLGLLTLWILGRLAVAGVLGLPDVGVMIVDAAFLAAVCAMIAREIVAGRNWRNLKVCVPVLLFLSANLMFHAEAMTKGAADYGLRLGFSVVVFLIMLIGGRIIPSFTRNWLAKRGASRMPKPFGRFDGLSLAVGATGLLTWTAAPWSVAAGLALGLAGGLHVVRLVRWEGRATWRSPLLLMLHIAYAFVPMGLFATAAASVGWVAPAMGIHLLGIGAIGGMTLAVMMRATRGHTGRSLDAGPALTAAFVLIVGAALLRALGAYSELAGVDGITLAATLWTAGFAIVVARIAPWLALPAPERKRAQTA
ncbi:NnrS family protein [Histidinibacterium aquaticum]|uniref:NnrS family protein n=1 Tax=Histidinibacterium aquaticum TaxID=2613962 RepID=A0A5J5GP27_9RHOB|nr:NnrS family protein [Histidinibacterium aquaticum]KAA9010079.1 NnrS family protein [Histidinibacterium aquaticum]